MRRSIAVVLLVALLGSCASSPQRRHEVGASVLFVIPIAVALMVLLGVVVQESGDRPRVDAIDRP